MKKWHVAVDWGCKEHN